MEIDLFENFTYRPRILITGGAGFIGNSLVRRLLLNSNCLIFNLDKISYASDLSPINNTIQSLGQESENRHFLMKLDLFNSSDTDSAVEHSDPDLVLHLAAESHVDNSIKRPNTFINSNIIGTYNLLESVRKHYNKLNNARRNAFRFLHISTDEVFGSLGENGYFNESSRYDPRSPYSASKAASDHLVNAWHHTFDMPTLITNCSNNYGPWQNKEKLIPKIIFNAVNNLKIPIYGDGENIRDWLYVEDHITGLLKVLKYGKIGQKYCIGGNQEKTNNEVANKICEFIDKISPKSYSHKQLITYVEDRLGHDKRYAINSLKIKTELDWEPSFTFDNAIEITTTWYVNNFKKLS